MQQTQYPWCHSFLICTLYSETALDAVTDNTGPFAGLEQQRRNVGADLVVLMRPYVGDQICGIAWVGGYGTYSGHSYGDMSGSDRWGYSHVSVDCPEYVLGHELGLDETGSHGLGNRRLRRQHGV